MNDLEKVEMLKKAYADYVRGMKYKDIAEKYEVSINTVKSWKRRYKWIRSAPATIGAVSEQGQNLGNTIFQEIKNDLLKQLKDNNTEGKHFEDLVNDYMSLWDIKNKLIDDINKRGVSVKWKNGKQEGMKKNDSIPELNKTSAQMLKILSELGIKPSNVEEDDDDDI